MTACHQTLWPATQNAPDRMGPSSHLPREGTEDLGETENPSTTKLRRLWWGRPSKRRHRGIAGAADLQQMDMRKRTHGLAKHSLRPSASSNVRVSRLSHPFAKIQHLNKVFRNSSVHLSITSIQFGGETLSFHATAKAKNAGPTVWMTQGDRGGCCVRGNRASPETQGIMSREVVPACKQPQCFNQVQPSNYGP